MARILGRPSIDGRFWTINLNSTNLTPCPSPGGGLLKFDLHMKVKHTYSLVHGNPSSQSQQFFQFNFPTLRLFSTTLMNRAQYSSALHLWLRQLLQADVVNDVTDHVIEHLFDNIINPTTLHDEIFAFHVQIDLNCVSNETLEELDHYPDDDVAGPATGLSEFLILLLMRMSVFPAPAKEELECRGLRDCSICLDDLVSGGGEEKTNYLFESRLCGHVFHGGCMKKWLRISDSCPLCRLVVSSEIKRILEEIMLSYRLE